MNTRALAIAIGLSAALGAIALSVGPVGAQSFGGSQAPLGNVEVTNRVDVSATTPPGTWLAVAADESGTRLEVGVPAGVAITNTPAVTVSNTVGVTGAVELGPVSAALLAGRTCNYGPIGHILLDGGVNAIAGMTARTGITIVAHDFAPGVDYVSCWPGLPDGGASPNCTVGTAGIGVPIHQGGSASFDVSNAFIVRCLTCNHAGGPGATTALVGGANSQCTP